MEITRGILGFVGFRKEPADLACGQEGSQWRHILKASGKGLLGAGEVFSIFEGKGNGKSLTTLGGVLFEVGDLRSVQTFLGLGPFDARLRTGSQ